MKKIIVSFMAVTAIFFSFIIPASIVSAAEFISIGTGGPTGVYFVVGNSVCRMVHKEAAEGRKADENMVYDVQLLQLVDQIIILVKSKKANCNLV